MSANFNDWLYDPRNGRYRVTLVEIHAASGLYRLATQPYFQPDGAWDDLLLDDIIIESAIDASVTAGDFTFADTYRTHWRTEDFRGRACRIWLGDTRWARSQFAQIADLVIDHIQRVADDTYRVTFSDEVPKLKEQIKGVEVGGQAVPVVFGAPLNVSPIMVDYATRKYKFSDAALTAITAVRDRGLAPASITRNLTDSSITLGVNPAGQVTGDIVSPISSLRDVVATLLTRAGLPTTAAAIEMRRFPATHPNGYQTNLCITENPRYFDTINDIVNNAGASLTRTATGAYRLTYLSLTGTPIATLTTDDIIDISEEGREPLYKTIVVKYNRNWTVQGAGTLAGGVPLADVKRFGMEYWDTLETTTTAPDINDGTLEVKTYTDQSGATVEMQRLAQWHASTMRRKWRIEATQNAIQLECGDIIEVQDAALNSRALVTRIRKNYTDLTASMEVVA